MQAKQLLLTWPQNSKSKKDVLDGIKTFIPYEWACVSEEKHKDGSPHLHAVIKAKERKRWPHVNLDKIGGKHGNYKGTTSLYNSLKYIIKDEDFIADGIDPVKYLEEIEKHKSHKADEVAGMVTEGKAFDDVLDKYPGFALMNKRKIDDLIDYCEIKKQKVDLLPWEDGKKVILDTISMHDDHDSLRRIFRWIYLNIKTKRQFKQKQLYIHGPPNLGKTSLILWLSKYLRIYHMEKNGYSDGYNDGCYDLIVMDEFKAQKTISFWNEWLQGSVMPLNVRFRHRVKRDNLPVIILSNYSLEQAYTNTDNWRLEPLKARLTIVEIDTFITIKENNTNTII